MNLTVTESGSKEFYSEVVYTTMQKKRLNKNPHRKIKNPMTSWWILLVVAVSFLVFDFVCLIKFGGTTFIVCLFVMCVLVLAEIIVIARVEKLKKTYITNFSKTEVTIDEEGVIYDKEKGDKLTLRWDTIQNVLINKETITFLSNQDAMIILCLSMKFRDDVERALAELEKSDLIVDNTALYK